MQQDHQSHILIDSPPPYQLQDNGIYLPDMDLNAWPSTYYGRGRRIDLAKFYHDILKASSNDDDDQCSDSSNSSSDEDERVNQNNSIRVTSNQTKNSNQKSMNIKNKKKNKKVTFSEEPATIHEYEPEYDSNMNKTNPMLFDDGWPGRTKIAMKSSGFIDFKSKIEAKLSAINDPSLISELDKSNDECIVDGSSRNSLLYNINHHQEELSSSSPSYRGYYRHRKSPLVKKLNLRPIPNTEQQVQPTLDDTPSPSNSYTDSPLTTPKDAHSIPLMGDITQPSLSSTSTASSNTSSILTPSGSKWLNRTLSKLRSTSSSSRTKS